MKSSVRFSQRPGGSVSLALIGVLLAFLIFVVTGMARADEKANNPSDVENKAVQAPASESGKTKEESQKDESNRKTFWLETFIK